MDLPVGMGGGQLYNKIKFEKLCDSVNVYSADLLLSCNSVKKKEKWGDKQTT